MTHDLLVTDVTVGDRRAGPRRAGRRRPDRLDRRRRADAPAADRVRRGGGGAAHPGLRRRPRARDRDRAGAHRARPPLELEPRARRSTPARRRRTAGAGAASCSAPAGTRPAGPRGAGRPGTTWTPSSADRPAYLARVDVHSADGLHRAARPRARHRRPARLVAPTAGSRLDAHHAARTAAYGVGRRRRSAGTPSAPTLRRRGRAGHRRLHEMAGPEVSGADDLAGLLGAGRRARRARRCSATGASSPSAAAWTSSGSSGWPAPAGDLFCDGAFGSHTAALRGALRRPAGDRRATATSTADAGRRPRRACTLAGIQAGFHCIGDAAVDAGARRRSRPSPSELGRDRRPRVPAPARARGDDRRRPAIERMRDARHGRQRAAGLRRALGRRRRHVRRRLGVERALRSTRSPAARDAGVALALGQRRPGHPDPWGGVHAARRPPHARLGRCARSTPSTPPPTAAGTPPGPSTPDGRWPSARPRHLALWATARRSSGCPRPTPAPPSRLPAHVVAGSRPSMRPSKRALA